MKLEFKLAAPLRNVLICEPKHYKKITEQANLSAIAEAVNCFDFEVVHDAMCDPGRAYLIDGDGVIHTFHIVSE